VIFWKLKCASARVIVALRPYISHHSSVCHNDW